MFASDHTWTGGSFFGTNWTDAGNWKGLFNAPPLNGLTSSRIIFSEAVPAAGQQANLDSNFSIHELLFQSAFVPVGPDSFILGSSSGKTLTIGSGGITNNLATQGIFHAVSIGADQTWRGGDLDIYGTLSGSGSLTLSDGSAGRPFIFRGNGTARTGPLAIDNAALVITHAAALGPNTTSLIPQANGHSELFLGAPIVTNSNINVAGSPLGTVTIGTDSGFPVIGNSEFAGQITLARDVVLRGGGADRTTFSGKITGAGNLTVTSLTGVGRVVIDRPSGVANDFVGDVTINDAILQLGMGNSIGNRALPDAATIRFNSSFSSLRLSPTGTTDGEIVGTLISTNLGGGFGVVDMITGTNFTLSIGGDGESGTFSGRIINSAGALTINKVGGGTQTLAGNNTYSGLTIVSQGALVLNHANALSSSNVLLAPIGSNNASLLLGAAVVTNNSMTVVANGGTGPVTLGSTDFNPGPVNSEFAGQLTLQRNTVLQAGSTDRTTFSGKITGTGTLTVTSPFGDGRRIVIDRPSGAANDFVGDVTIAGNATLQLGVANAIGNRTLPDAATVRFDNSFSSLRLAPTGTTDGETVGTLISNSFGAGVVDMFTGTAFTLSIGGDGESGTFGGRIINSAGALTINKVGGGTQTLTGSNTYSGGTRISSGKLIVDTNSLPASNGVVNIATLEFNQTFDGTYAGVINNLGSLYKTGEGTLTLNQDNGFAGAIIVQNGTLGVGRATALGSGAANVQMFGGGIRVQGGPAQGFALSNKLEIFGSFTLGRVTHFVGPVVLGNSAAIFIDNPDGPANSFSDLAAISGPARGLTIADGPLFGSGTGGIRLTGANTYTGGTTVNSGRLVVAPAGALAATGPVTLNGGELKFENNAQMVSSLSGTGGSLVLQPTALTVNQAITTTFAGGVSGTGGLIKIGPGVLTLSGNSIYSGPTVVIGGTLAVNASGRVNTNSLQVSNPGSRLTTGDPTDVAGGRITATALAITGGGNVTSRVGYVGATLEEANSIILDRAEVSGAGSLWETRFVSIGQGSKGTLLVTSGGRVATTHNISIGNTSDGDLFIAAGGVVDTGANGTVGRTGGVIGRVIVGSVPGQPTSGDARWNVAGSVYLGGTNVVAGGTGSLTVSINGVADVASIVKTWTGGTATVNGVLHAATMQNLGLLAGAGTINADVLNSNGGIVAPGNSPGLLSVNGDYTQDTGSSLRIEIGGRLAGTEHDVLNISGSATLAGSLDVSLVNLGAGVYAPGVGDSFDILRANTLQGRFGNLSYAPLDANLAWHIAYLTDEFGSTDVVRLSVAAVPEPETWIMMLAGLGLVGALTRRKTQR